MAVSTEGYELHGEARRRWTLMRRRLERKNEVETLSPAPPPGSVVSKSTLELIKAGAFIVFTPKQTGSTRPSAKERAKQGRDARERARKSVLNDQKG